MLVYIKHGDWYKFVNGFKVDVIPVDGQSTINTLSGGYKSIIVSLIEIIEVSTSQTVKIMKKY